MPIFGQGPRVSHRWWETLQACRNTHYKTQAFPDYISMLLSAGIAEVNTSPSPGTLLGEFRGVISSRHKTLIYTRPDVEVKDEDDVCDTLSITSNDLIAILVGVGYNIVCSKKISAPL